MSMAIIIFLRDSSFQVLMQPLKMASSWTSPTVPAQVARFLETCLHSSDLYMVALEEVPYSVDSKMQLSTAMFFMLTGVLLERAEQVVNRKTAFTSTMVTERL